MEPVKSILKDRIKWHTPLDEEYASILSDDLKAGSENKTFQSAHRIVTVGNIHKTQPDENISDIDFNEYLRRLNNDCVDSVVEDVLYDKSISNSAVVNFVNRYLELFDKAMKYQMAIKVIE